VSHRSILDAALFLPLVTHAQTSSSESPQQLSFRVHVIDGRNGAAVSNVHLQLWYDEPAGQGYSVATDAHGIALMPAPVGEPVRVLASIVDWIDCRKPERGAPPQGYNMAAIANDGTAAQNTCGSVAIRTQPGELVLFVRPSRWYEGINRNQ
jgi:hypothetical protein